MSKNEQNNLFSMPEISEKSKKNEIFDAYQELLSKIKETKQVSHQEEKKKQDETMVITKASTFKVDKIVANIADVKLSIGQSLDTLEQRLIAEYRRLNELEEAIALETKELEDLHEIKKNVDTLNALLLAQKEYKVRFEQHMEQQQKDFSSEMIHKKSAWKKEQEEAELEQKERELRTKKDRAREEEEYRYALQLERKKNQDFYEAKQAALEKELIEKKTKVLQDLKTREEAIIASETELATLQDHVENFPKELEKAVKETEKTTRESLERNYRFQMDLAAKELEGERKLNHQIINSLQSKIKEQEEFIRQLTHKTDEAGTQVQAIALKALEGASFHRYHPASEDNKKTNQTIGG